MSSPKTFISYCWSTADHEQWVLRLAEELVESGVDVILDKWDLKEGHDTVAFMEQMVTDPAIQKVIIVCDRTYAAKADKRLGGVGTETQIISREVYEKSNQEKFVAVVAELDDQEKPCLPTYYKSRIYIDLSRSDQYAPGFEKLLRWLFDRPLYVKPELGKPPSYLSGEAAISTGTSALAKRAIDAVRNEKGYAGAALTEYLSAFVSGLERFRFPFDGKEDFDEHVVRAIDASKPSRDEYVKVLSTFALYGDEVAVGKAYHHFFEAAYALYSAPAESNSWNEAEFDGYRFIGHELFLYTIGDLLRSERLGVVDKLLGEPFYIEKNLKRGRDTIGSFLILRENIQSLNYRNKRLGLNRISLRADLLEKRAHASGFEFRYLMQADFVCFLRAEATGTDRRSRWHPETLLYASNHYGPFEIFARASSRARLDKLLPVLGVSSLSELKALENDFGEGCRHAPRWDYESLNIAQLMGINELGTRP